MPADNNTPASTGGAEKAVPDARQQALQDWLQQQLGISAPGLAASSDASFRRYFRFPLDSGDLIAMDAPPATEDCRPFVKVAGLLREAGVVVPDILAQDLDQGFLALSDLGRDTLLQYMSRPDFDSHKVEALYSQAIDIIVRMQQIDVDGLLPSYGEALLRRELDLFPEWYIGRQLQRDPGETEAGLLSALFAQLIEGVTQQSYVFVHRDFMPRNLMVTGAGHDLGVLDFQDAVLGPISYDPICLFKDAFISWPESEVEKGLREYWQKAIAAGLPVPADFEVFMRDCDYMGAQRHLKVIGIFARICHRDGKPHYLNDVPRFFQYLNSVAKRRPELPLQSLLEVLGEAR